MCLPRLLVIRSTKTHLNTRCKQGLIYILYLLLYKVFVLFIQFIHLEALSDLHHTLTWPYIPIFLYLEKAFLYSKSLIV